jgi:hypothetical protein
MRIDHYCCGCHEIDRNAHRIAKRGGRRRKSESHRPPRGGIRAAAASGRARGSAAPRRATGPASSPSDRSMPCDVACACGVVGEVASVSGSNGAGLLVGFCSTRAVSLPPSPPLVSQHPLLKKKKLQCFKKKNSNLKNSNSKAVNMHRVSRSGLNLL